MKTISLDNAQRLQELGVTRESYFWYDKDGRNSIIDRKFHKYPAYTADELGEMLPVFPKWDIYKIPKGWKCYVKIKNDHIIGHFNVASAMADAMALMLIWLIENDHIKVEDL